MLKFIVKQDIILDWYYLNILQGSVAMHLKCGEIFNGCIIADLLLIALVKEF